MCRDVCCPVLPCAALHCTVLRLMLCRAVCAVPFPQTLHTGARCVVNPDNNEQARIEELLDDKADLEYEVDVVEKKVELLREEVSERVCVRPHGVLPFCAWPSMLCAAVADRRGLRQMEAEFPVCSCCSQCHDNVPLPCCCCRCCPATVDQG